MGRKMSREEFEARVLHTLEESYTVHPTPRDAVPDGKAAEDAPPPEDPAAGAS